MAEQNILAGDIQVLQQVMSDIREHNDKTALLERLNTSVSDIRKQIDVKNKAVQDEIDSRVKSSTDAICAGFDKSIAGDKEKLKGIQLERERAKLAGVKERIDAETASLRAENEDLLEQIEEAFIQENISKFFNSRVFLSLFQSRKIIDVLIYMVFMAVLYIVVPAVCFFIPGFLMEGLLIYYAVMVLVMTSIYRFIYEKKVMPHIETITAAHDTKDKISVNRAKIKKIKNSIKKDQNEEMYGLDVYDDRISSLNDEISAIEGEKKAALEEFERTVKLDIVKEVQGQSAERIKEMEAELRKKTEEQSKVDNLVKKQRIYISSNYEAYLGKEYVNAEKLQSLNLIMKSGAADTIGQAVAAYKNRH
ncbi:MAG: hypothetical protein Q4F11_04940 [Eubacteriales bacterium]|nr:hypothetical protein [Eubacteriales bacterium]